MSFYAYASDHFFAAGRVQDTAGNATRIRLTWDDGYALEGEIENGTVLLFGMRSALEPATAEFLDDAGEIVGAHTALIDER